MSSSHRKNLIEAPEAGDAMVHREYESHRLMFSFLTGASHLYASILLEENVIYLLFLEKEEQPLPKSFTS